MLLLSSTNDVQMFYDNIMIIAIMPVGPQLYFIYPFRKLELNSFHKPLDAVFDFLANRILG